MRKVTITKSMPEHEAKRLLRSLAQPEGTVEEGLDDLIDALKQFEKKYGMSTLEFYQKFRAGETGDDMDVIEWAGLFEAFMILNQERAGTRKATR